MISLVTLAVILIVSSADAGVSYTRWGRTVCPAGSSRLFKGYMSGGHYAGGGSGANYLCMHEQPKFVKTSAGNQQYAGLVVGLEFQYEHKADNALTTKNTNGAPLMEQDAVCVVCYVSGSTDKLMVAGRQDCGEVGYDLQYKGYIVSDANWERKRAEYVCMDEDPEVRPGGSGDNNQGMLYIAKMGCGSLPCAPYIDGYEIPCSVCTY